MLAPADSHWNFLTEAAREAFESWSVTGSGLVADERAMRNLLSSQPLAFNLFGPFCNDPAPLLPWVRTIDADAATVKSVRLEWAPAKQHTLGGGSAFDVFLEYEAGGGSCRFLGIECKYAEDIASGKIKSIRHYTYPKGVMKGQRPPSYENYQRHTETAGLWKSRAVELLDEPRLRQFWLNTMLAQKVAEFRMYDRGTSIVMSSQHDQAAWEATRDVRSQLATPDSLRWAPYEALVGTLHNYAWVSTFVKRYLDFSPVRDYLEEDDPRRVTDQS